MRRLRPKSASLLTTLAVRLVVTTVALAAVLLVVLYWQLQWHFDSIHDRSLTSQAQDVAASIQRAPDGRISLDLPADLTQAYADADGGFFYQVRDPSGALLSSSPGGAAVLDEIAPNGDLDPQFFLFSKPGQHRLYAASVPVTGDFGTLIVRVGQSERHSDILIDQLLDEFIHKIGWILPLILALFLVVNIVTVRRSLAPIKTVSALARKIRPFDPMTLPEADLPDELRPLVRAANSAFARLGEALRTQREFTADAAHELRTPLAVLSANIDTLDDDAAKAALKHDLLTMTRIVDQLLKVAQLEAFVLDTTQQADLCALATDVAARLGHMAIEHGKSISVVVPERRVLARGDSVILRHGLTNLVENALSHTPTGKGVEITVEADGIIHVDDEGPGIPEGERALVFQRFWRKSRASAGAGIGLSIVAKIAVAHQGTIRVSSAPLGGARFTLTLPSYD